MKKAAVVINLGSPKSTDVKDVKEYLGEFLMDDHVIDFPKMGTHPFGEMNHFEHSTKKEC